jgi:thiol-disulfide isomerase/thioredoxin
VGRKVVMDLPSDTGVLISIGGGGEPLVLDFWAPTCKPCVQKIPALVAREAELRAKGVRLILIAVLAKEESTDAARATLASWGVSHPFLIDREDVSRRAAGVMGLPSTLVLDGTHVVRWVAEPTSTIDEVIGAVGR